MLREIAASMDTATRYVPAGWRGKVLPQDDGIKNSVQDSANLKLRSVLSRADMPKPFFNNHQDLYTGRFPAFHDVSGIEGVAQLEASVDLIRNELMVNLADPKRSAICFKKHAGKKQVGWRQIELMIYGMAYSARCDMFPVAMSILGQISGVSTAYFSCLEPQTTIPPHVGDTDAYYRVHLGLKVPTGLPECGIEVAGQQRGWEQGRCLAFNDIYCHTAWNHTNEERIVLIVDILRPEFRDRKLYVDTGVRATLYYSRLYEWLFPVIELLPRIITRLIRPVFHMVAWRFHEWRQRRR